MTDDSRSILHVDMDAFFVSVELLDRPELRGLPVIVGGPGARGVVAAASYEARAYGVHSAMPSVRASRLCPDAVFLSGDHARYAAVSRRVMDLFRSVTPLVEPISLDEAFLDVSGSVRLHGDAVTIAHRIRRSVADHEQLTCSVGVAGTKFLAKLASEAAKPRPSPTGPVPGLGVKVIEPGHELAFLHPLPVRALWGVGPATLAKLERIGVGTVAELARLPVAAVQAAVGDAVGRHLHDLAHARDDRPVVADARPKSISHEETFPHDLHDAAAVDREALRLGDGVASRLRKAELRGRTVSVKVRFGDFRTISRSLTLDRPTDSAREISRAARLLLEQVDPAPGIRLLGVGVSGLVESGAEQLSLDDVPGTPWQEAEDTVGDIRQRFGDDAIGPAALADAGRLRVKRRGDQQWGPGPDRPTDS